MNNIIDLGKMFVAFLKRTEKKFWYIFVFLLLADVCIFLGEWNEGRIKTKNTQVDFFIVQQITYNKTNKTSQISILEPEVLVVGKSLTTYSFILPVTSKELNSLKVKKGKKIKIKNKILYNNAGKTYRVIETVFLTGKQGEISYNLQ